jgi:hypothetical protein
MKPQDLRDQLRYAYDPQFRGFHHLMAKRVRTILMVSNPYESFSLSRDHSLSQDIYGTSQLLHLQNVPQIVTALSGREALERLGTDHFDLVLASANLPDMSTSDFGRRLRAAHPSLPVVLIVFDGRWFDRTFGGSEPPGIDWIFAWQGSANVLLSIMKLVEDRQNIDADLRLASIGTILVVEDSVEHYSLLLPHLYAMLMQRSFSLVPDGINESERQVRTRVRPKVLLARTFGEARGLFERYESSLLGVISDLRTVRDDHLNPRAGYEFLQELVARAPGVPILVQSSEPDVAVVAQSLGARCLVKGSAKLRAVVEQFVLADIGFGDFVFRLPNGQEVRHVSNLWEMENALKTVADESIVYHAERNDLSHWFRARGETTLAAILRPITTTDFPTTAALKEYLSSAVSIARKEKYRGAIADFRLPEFDPSYPFLVLGRGSLGGKGRGLAFVFHELSQRLKDDRIEGVLTRLPRTLVIGADESDAFLKDNGIEPAELGHLSDNELTGRFAAGRLRPELLDGLRGYLERVRVPLAVRSSSLLEDSHYQPSAGLYATYMLPNNHDDPGERLEQLVSAIRMVYASAYLERPRRYLEAIGMDPSEAKMAVVIQEVVGRRYGDTFYPPISGVAQSHNHYPVFQMKPEDGVATVALGLGKQVVEGGDAVRFCPRYPEVLPQFNTPKDVLAFSQREFFALDLTRSTSDLTRGSEATLIRLPLSVAEEHGTLQALGSVYSEADDRLYDGLGRPGPRLVTFARILKQGIFPLCAIVNTLLDMCRERLGFAVEIEFAVSLDQDPEREPEFHFLQMRPLVARRERCDLALESIPTEMLLCRSARVMGNGHVEGVRDIVYIHPERFERSYSNEAAAAVAALNERLGRERRTYVLIGPGRWGSFDPWIGIPVVWHQISWARVIVESSAKDLPMEPSQGTHFFHNLTSAGIGYFSLRRASDDEFVRWDLLDALPGEEITPWLRLLRTPRPLDVLMDGQTQRGLIALT